MQAQYDVFSHGFEGLIFGQANNLYAITEPAYMAEFVNLSILSGQQLKLEGNDECVFEILKHGTKNSNFLFPGTISPIRLWTLLDVYHPNGITVYGPEFVKTVQSVLRSTARRFGNSWDE